MTDKPETVADVLAEMRDPFSKGGFATRERWAAQIERAMAASAAPDDWRKRIVSLERGFEFDEIMRVHTPTVILRFSSIDSRNPDTDAQGWQDRDAVAALIVRASPAVPVESPPASVPDGWMPIESAPKDGARVLVTRYPFTGAHAPINISWWGTDAYKKKAWIRLSKRRLRYEPTHWMPLPAPPTTPEPRT